MWEFLQNILAPIGILEHQARLTVNVEPNQVNLSVMINLVVPLMLR
jgi:hypothetical protein